MSQQVSLVKRMHELLEAGQAFVTCTLLASEGHAPQEAGAKALIVDTGLAAGTIGGGKIEHKVIKEGLALLGPNSSYQQPLIVEWDLQRDVGMTCGGRVKLLFEVFGHKPWRIAIFGAGHVAQAVARVLIQLDCQVVCVDPRPEWVERLPSSKRLRAHVLEDMPQFASDLMPGTFCAVLTMGHSTDLPILKKLLPRQDIPFVGSIGSNVKARLLKAELLRAGLSQLEIKRLACPIGLRLGSRLPEEIAISITAQLLLARDGQEFGRESAR